MHRTIDPPHAAWVAVISAGRASNVAHMTDLIGAATWYVPDSEVGRYQDAGAERVIPTVSLVDARNRALEDAAYLGVVCVQLDDDLVRVEKMHGGRAQKTAPLDAIAELVFRLMLVDSTLGGMAPTNNPYFSRKALSTNLFVLGSLMAVKPTGIRFDPQFLLKEDYDFTIQHYLGAGVLRCDDLLPTFKHYTNRGGAVRRRTAELEAEMVSRLQRKWGPLVKPHPRRENEVLLRLPRHKSLEAT